MSHKPLNPDQIDDPWNPVIRHVRETPAAPARTAAAGAPGVIEVGHYDSNAARTSVSTELVDLLTDNIAAAPERADLWMMRFEMYRTLGMKPDFASALTDAWGKPRVRRQLDWVALRALWDSIAAGEPLPDGVSPALPATTTAAAATTRRFADVAMQVAGNELGALSTAYGELRRRPGFYGSFARELAPVLNRPSPLILSAGLTRIFGGNARIFLKREDRLRHTPELVNATAQAHIAGILGKRSLVTANDVDAHAMMLATIAPRFGLPVTVFVREGDFATKGELIERLRQRGVTVESATVMEPITTDPREAALRHWQLDPRSHLALSLGAGPRPYPTMVNDFQSLLGRETVLQLRTQTEGQRPWTFVAAAFSEADAIGFMVPHLTVPEIPLFYAEPDRSSTVTRSSARARAYNGHRREHAWLKGSGRIGYSYVPDAQAREAQDVVRETEGCDLSLEDARAVVAAERLARGLGAGRDIVVLVA